MPRRRVSMVGQRKAALLLCAALFLLLQTWDKFGGFFHGAYVGPQAEVITIPVPSTQTAEEARLGNRGSRDELSGRRQPRSGADRSRSEHSHTSSIMTTRLASSRKPKTSPLRIHLVTYASEEFVTHAEDLIQSMEPLASCHVTAQMYTPADLEPGFVSRNARSFNTTWGGGLWIWKPYVILDKLRDIEYGDWLFYIDSRYLFEKDICEMIPRNSTYRCFSRKAGEPQYPEVPWTKYDAYILMDVEPDHDAIQPWAGSVIFQKTKENMHFVQQWLHYCEDYRIVSPDQSIFGSELEGFRETRADQQVHSLLLRKWNRTCMYLPEHWLFNIRSNMTR